MKGLWIVAVLLLSACTTTSSRDPASIRPVFELRNSPMPVPWPKSKPARGTTYQKPADRPAQTIRPSSEVHRVARGETLYGIARRYDLSLRHLIKTNGLRPPYALAVGQKLALPSKTTHKVRKGDTGYSLSRRYGVTVSALMAANNIRAPYRLSVGQTLIIPGGGSQRVTAINSSPRPSTNKPVQVTKNRRGRTVPLPKPPARTSSRFLWPVAGKIASRFGPKEGGRHNDGINILASQGAAVRASEAGVVAYASNALEGYGNLLLVKHSGGWVTAYAHNERLLVREGQQVKRGEVIARVGQSGGVEKPQLHFEIRKGRQAHDPLRYLERLAVGTR